MADITSFFFPQTSGTASRAGSLQNAKQGQPFSVEFYSLLQGELTNRDIDNMSDAQINALGEFLANLDESSYRGPETVKLMRDGMELEGINVTPSAGEMIRAEDNPAVLKALERIQSASFGEKQDVTAFEKLGSLIEQLLNGIPQESRKAQSELAAMNAEATAIAVDSNGNTEKPSPLQARGDAEARAELIATGLTPDEITRLLEKLENLKRAADADLNAELEGDVTFTLVTPSETTPAGEEQNVIFLPRGIVVSENRSQGEHKNTKAGENVARALNKALESLVTQGGMNGLYGEESAQNGGSAKEGESSFDRVFSMFREAKSDHQSSPTGKIQDSAEKSSALTASQPPTHAEAKAAAKLSAGLSTIQFNQQQALQNLSSSGAWEAVYPEGFDWSTAPGAQSSPNNSVQLATMTSLVSQNNAATATHPATQMVAATITKAGQSDNKMLTLRLDPPDLGRVQVRMELTEDNVVKAIISSEKPQTHMMLQRDAHALERALQDAGLDTKGGSLEFELAEDGSLFGDNDGRGGENDSGSGSSSGGENSENDGTLIESTMTWQVDPETGYMHYNLVV